MKHRDEGGKAGGCIRMYLFLLINLVKLWCDMGQEKWMTSEFSSNAFSLHLKVCFSKELTNLLLVFHRIPFQAWHRTGIIKWEPIYGGDQTMQMHGKFEGFPRKYHWNPLKQIGTFWGGSHKRIRASSFPKWFSFFEIQGNHWWWPFWTKTNKTPIFNKKLIFKGSIFTLLCWFTRV